MGRRNPHDVPGTGIATDLPTDPARTTTRRRSHARRNRILGRAAPPPHLFLRLGATRPRDSLVALGRRAHRRPTLPTPLPSLGSGRHARLVPHLALRRTPPPCSPNDRRAHWLPRRRGGRASQSGL